MHEPGNRAPLLLLPFLGIEVMLIYGCHGGAWRLIELSLSRTSVSLLRTSLGFVQALTRVLYEKLVRSLVMTKKFNF